MTDALAINLSAPCWLFQGRLLRGYGQVYWHDLYKLNGRGTIPAHRYMWTVMRGPIPKGMHIHHLCGVTRCVNPQHLMLMRPGDHTLIGNSWAGRHARTTHCPKGHAYDETNTIRRGTKRWCLECRRIADRGRRPAEFWREYRRKRKEQGRPV